LNGQGVEKDATHGVSLLRQLITEVNTQMTDHRMRGCLVANCHASRAVCYETGNGVEADTVQAALFCRRAAEAGSQQAIDNLPIIRQCDFCGSTPARQLCTRCRKVRYCGAGCQRAHWSRATDPHKGPCKEHCRRAAEASQQEAGGASTSTQ
jgi:TPR repeat protein